MKILAASRSRLVFAAGAVAMAVAVAVSLASRVGFGTPTLPELVGDNLVILIPGNLFELGIALLGPLAKKLLLVALNVGLILAGGGLALALDRLNPLGPRTAGQALLSGLRAGLAAVVVVGGLVALLGTPAMLGPALGMLALVAVVYGLVLTAADWRRARPVIRRGQRSVSAVWYPYAPRLSRRGLAAAAGTVAAGAAVLIVARAARSPDVPSTSGTEPVRPPSPSPVATPAATVATVAAPSTPTAEPTEVGATASESTGTGPAATSTATPASKADANLPIPAGAEPEITPTDQFYKVSKNFLADPRVDVRQWQLRVDGLVEKASTFGLADLRGMPSLEKQHTLTCISNEVGGKLISNAAWKGVRLADVLRQVGIKPGVRKVVLYGADGYTDSIPLDRALDAGALLAYEMNGATLPPEHGFPLRLLVPDIYGMKNVKWITRIELVSTDCQGYWQRGGWSDPAVIKTSSRIDVARATSVAQPISLAGIAFAGERGISAVEVSADDGKIWLPAQVKSPDAPNVWTLWVAQWIPQSRGAVRLTVRAVDGTGQVQESTPAQPFPDGASGLHAVSVSV